ncbi:MAG TPA: RNA polymerase sigma factor [Armatimonadetes bacterium]|nr:RNA polymerase sigma factor [Armatimonadota bacterium]
MAGETHLRESTADLSQLVQRAKEGDMEAFEQIFHRLHRYVYRLAYQMVGHEEDATDLTQEVFVRVYTGLPRLREVQTFLTWLRRMTLNLCRTHLKKKKRWRVISLDEPAGEEEPLAEQIPDLSAEPGQQMEAAERQALLRQAIAALPLLQREVVVLHHLEGLEIAQIAQILRCPEGTVKSRLARAREALKRRLRPYVEG